MLSITSMGDTNNDRVLLALGRAGYTTQLFEYPIIKTLKPIPVVAVTGPTSIIVAGATDGSVPSSSLPVAISLQAVNSGTGVTVTNSYSWSRTDPAGITSSISAGVLTVTAMDAGTDQGTISVVASRSGWPNIPYTVTVSKTRLLLPTTKVVSSLPPVAVYASGTSVSAHFRVTTDGLVQMKIGSGSWTTIGNWYNPTTTSIGSTHSVRVNFSGSTAGMTGTFNAWQTISSDIEFSVVAGGIGGQVTLSGKYFICANSNLGAVLGQGDLTLDSFWPGS